MARLTRIMLEQPLKVPASDKQSGKGFSHDRIGEIVAKVTPAKSDFS
jgi:hypothetical protein